MGSVWTSRALIQLGGVGLLTMGLMPVPAAAQTPAGERVFVDLGRWTISEQARARTCVLRHVAADGSRLTMTKIGTGLGVLSLDAPRPSIFVGDVVFAFDQDEFPGRVVGDRTYTPISSSAAIEEAFRRARILTVRHGGASIATIPLKTSSAGFRLLKQCSEQGRMGIASASRPNNSAPRQRETVAAAPPPPTALAGNNPATPDRASASPEPPAISFTDPVPRNPANWLKPEDIDRFWPSNWGGGVIDFTLLVNPRGRVEECAINSSSGSREFDGRICRTLQRRARFEPALDNQGNPAEGRYRSSLRFQLPE